MIKITNLAKLWWSGDKEVEKYMEPIRDVLDKYFDKSTDAWINIYNRTYEAIYKALKSKGNK